MFQLIIIRFVLLVFLQNYSIKAYLSSSSINSAGDCSLYLSIDLNGRVIEESNLMLNWPIDCARRPKIEWIGLYPLDPRKFHNILHPLLRFDQINETIYRLPLSWRLGLLHFPKGWNRHELNQSNITPRQDKACLDYYVAAFRKTELLAVYCLKVYPRWTNTFSSFSLKQLFIPGTHCSGAYISNHQFDRNNKDHSIEQYTITQYMDIWSQLVFGIRYLDLSVGYRSIVTEEFNHDHNSDWNHFWIVNENQFIRPLRIILDDVKDFLTIAKGEIIIIDFSSFQIGFYQHPERHAKLIQLLESLLGDIAYRPSTPSSCSDANIGDIISSSHTLIILYPLEELPHPEDESPILCQAWKRFSSNKMNNLTEILHFMRIQFGKKKSATIVNEAWIFNAIRSPIEFNSNSKNQGWSSIKKGALHFNIKAANWLKGPWGLNANVVTMDYFSNTNLIEIAIKANLQKWLKFKSKLQII